jgi:molybdopterin molybdotransferase
MLRLADMQKLIVERVTPVGETERVKLREACGRISAADIKAPIDLPPFDN